MMNWSTALLAVKELGLSQLGWFAWYQLKLRSGIVRRQTAHAPHTSKAGSAPFLGWFRLPESTEFDKIIDPARLSQLIHEADEISAGQIRLFGGPTVDLKLRPPAPQKHWTQISETSAQDIKFTWEPARFGWACTLARAYFFTADERYAGAFWSLAKSTPINCLPSSPADSNNASLLRARWRTTRPSSWLMGQPAV